MSRNVQPNYSYLDAKLSISSADALKKEILGKCDHLNMKEMANDVRPFLFENSDAKKIVQFADVVRQYSFE